jgi:FMN phosphatase YigB (HAD superfamily)
MIRLICFDLEETLVVGAPYQRRARRALLSHAAEKSGLQSHTIDARYRAIRSGVATDLAAYACLGLTQPDVASVLDHLDPGPGVRATAESDLILKLLARLGFELALITNAPCGWAEQLLGNAGLDVALFKAIVTSCDVSHTKPSTEPFERALEICGVPASEAVMVGDREDVDLAPARSLGLQGILVTARRPLIQRFPELLWLATNG